MPTKTIGILHSGKQLNQQRIITAFKNELERWVQGTAITIAWDPAGVFWSDDDTSLLVSNARTLATNSNLDLIIAAGGSASVYAVQDEQTRAGIYTNVVFTTFSQMQSPAPNMCGVCAHTSDQDLTRMQRLHAILNARSYGVLENKYRRDYDAAKFDSWEAAQNPSVTLDHKFVKNTPTDTEAQVVQNIEAAFAAWRGMNPPITAALVCADPIFNDHRAEIRRAARPTNGVRIRTMHQWHDFVTGGHGDYAFGSTLREAYELAAKAAKDVLVLGKSPAQVGVLSLSNLRLLRHGIFQRMLAAIFPKWFG